MKKKNLILAAAAFCFAVGGAIASSFALEDVYVHARLTAGGAIQCINTGVPCDESGAGICSVQVTTTKPSTGGSQIATTTGTFKTYKVGCPTVIKNLSDVLSVSSLQVYELQP